MSGSDGEGAKVFGFDVFRRHQKRSQSFQQRQRDDAARRATENAMVTQEKQKHEAAHSDWQRMHDATETALHEHEVFFRDIIKTARHAGEKRLPVRIKQSVRELQARNLADNPFGRLFLTCGSDTEFSAVAEAIEHWLGAQAERLGNVWVEYDGVSIPDTKSYEHKHAREDGEMTIVWSE